MFRNLTIAALMVVWFVAVVICTLARQWSLVVSLFGIAWLAEQVIACRYEEE